MSLAFPSNSRIRAVTQPQKASHRLKGFEFQVFVGNKWVRYSNALGVLSVPNTPYKRIEWIKDVKHPGPPFVTGGPLLCVKANIDDSVVVGNGTYTSGSDVFSTSQGIGPTRYVGGFTNPNFSGLDAFENLYGNHSLLTSNPTVVLPLDSFYPSVAKVRPKISEADLAVFIGELRDLPKMLKGLSMNFHDLWKGKQSPMDRGKPFMSSKEAAGDFLGIQFGWMPFLSDMKRLYDTTLNVSSLLKTLVQRNGQWDKKGRVFFDDEQEELVSSGNSQMRVTPSGPELDKLCNSLPTVGPYYWTCKRRTLRKVWMSGQYRFYRPEFDPNLPEFDSNWNYIQQLLTLYGARVNPSVIWKLTPWTWLIDWFSSVGSIIDQLTIAQNDAVVSKELYLMHRREVKLEFHQVINFKDGTHTFSFERNLLVKQRDHAVTPYGFGLLPNGLSGMQYAILAALGISRFS